MKDLSVSLMMLSNEELSYLAGLFDGEGSAGVYIINRKPDAGHPHGVRHTVPSVQLRMCDRDPVLACKTAFGGSLSYIEKTDQRKAIFAWRASHHTALKVAIALLPFSRNPSKHAQFNKIIDHYKLWTRPIRGRKRHGIPDFEALAARLASGYRLPNIEFQPKEPYKTV